MLIVKRVFFFLLAVLLVLALLIGGWLLVPVTVDRTSPDPAVEYANSRDSRGMPYQEGYFEHGDHRLHYVEAGQGETILFLHGFPSFWYSHIRQMDALKADYHVLAIDSLGAGRSDAPADQEAYRLESMLEHLLALVDHLGQEKVHLVGHDWGSGFAFAFAQRYPERVRSVTGNAAAPQSVILELIETDARHREIFAYVERFKAANSVLLLALRVGQRIYDGSYKSMLEAGKLTPEEGQLFANATRDPKRINAFINWYRANVPAPGEIVDSDFFPARGARITPPALFIWGSEDPIVTNEGMAALREVSDNLQTMEVKGVGHWPHVYEHERVTNRIRGLIKANSQYNSSQ